MSKIKKKRRKTLLKENGRKKKMRMIGKIKMGESIKRMRENDHEMHFVMSFFYSSSFHLSPFLVGNIIAKNNLFTSER